MRWSYSHIWHLTELCPKRICTQFDWFASVGAQAKTNSSKWTMLFANVGYYFKYRQIEAMWVKESMTKCVCFEITAKNIIQSEVACSSFVQQYTFYTLVFYTMVTAWWQSWHHATNTLNAFTPAHIVVFRCSRFYFLLAMGKKYKVAKSTLMDSSCMKRDIICRTIKINLQKHYIFIGIPMEGFTIKCQAILLTSTSVDISRKIKICSVILF